jgi:hypothetical protein
MLTALIMNRINLQVFSTGVNAMNVGIPGRVLVFGTLLSVAATGARAASPPDAAPFNFTGTVVKATSSCLHDKGTTVSGYTYWPGIDPGDSDPFHVGQARLKTSFVIAFSDGKTIKKIGYALKTDSSFKKPYTSGKGAATATIPSPLQTLKGSWTGAFAYDTESKFDLKLDVRYALAKSTCSIEYDLSFSKGIPARFINLL